MELLFVHKHFGPRETALSASLGQATLPGGRPRDSCLSSRGGGDHCSSLAKALVMPSFGQGALAISIHPLITRQLQG